jgi:hypothetical protein
MSQPSGREGLDIPCPAGHWPVEQSAATPAWQTCDTDSTRGYWCRVHKRHLLQCVDAALAAPAAAPAGKWNAAIEALEGLIVAQGRDGMPCWCQNGKNDIVVHSYACATARSVYLTRPDAPAPTDQAGERWSVSFADGWIRCGGREVARMRATCVTGEWEADAHIIEAALNAYQPPSPPRDTREDA